MEKETARAYGKALRATKEKKAVLKTNWIFKEAIYLIIAFFYGQISIFNIFNPLSVAFVSVFFLEGHDFYLMSVVAILSMALKGGGVALSKYIICFVAAGFLNFMISMKYKKIDLRFKSLLGGASIVLAGVLYSLSKGMSRYLIFVAVIEGLMVFSLTNILGNGIKTTNGGLKRKILSSEEIISIAVLISGIVAGASSFDLGPISLKIFLTTFLILIAGFRGGAGISAATGVLISFVLMVSGQANISLFFIFSISGLLCGALRNMGKFVCFLSFLIAASITAFYTDASVVDTRFILSVATGGLAFMALPKGVFSYLNTYISYEKGITEDRYLDKYKYLTQDKLKKFSGAFMSLSRVFIKEENTNPQKDITKIIDSVASKACNNCGVCTYCWETDFYNTYQVVFSILSKCEKTGQARVSDLPESFAKSCVRVENFVDTINRAYEIHKANIIWEGKISESKQLISEQLTSVSDIILGLSKEIDIRPVFNEENEALIKTELEKLKIDVRKVTVLETENSRAQVIIEHKPFSRSEVSGKTAVNDIIKAVNIIMNKKFHKEKNISSGDSSCVLRLIEEGRLKVSTAVAYKAKEENGVSGDCYSFMELNDGDFLIALSDGMGTGKKAHNESATTIELLEKFIDCGFEKDTAIKMINSVLVLNNKEESFSTLDICSINRYTGMGEFIKIGAASAYIIRNDTVKSVKNYSLPVGVFKNIEIEKINFMMKPGDIIILMTDGVADIIEKNGRGEEWLMEMFGAFRSNNPQDIADYILIQARKETGNQINDDMTVFAARIWEK